jgi:hypothetical protein
MRRLFTVFVAAAVVVAFSGMALAQAKQTSAEKKPAAQTEKAAAPATAKAGKASGTIKAASETSITLTTKEGDREFTLDPKVIIAEGTKTLKAADLASLVGQSTVVHYTESGSVMTVHKMTVAKPKAATAEKKETAKK